MAIAIEEKEKMGEEEYLLTKEDNFTYKYPRLIKDEEQRLECIIKDIEKRKYEYYRIIVHRYQWKII